MIIKWTKHLSWLGWCYFGDDIVNEKSAAHKAREFVWRGWISYLDGRLKMNILSLVNIHPNNNDRRMIWRHHGKHMFSFVDTDVSRITFLWLQRCLKEIRPPSIKGTTLVNTLCWCTIKIISKYFCMTYFTPFHTT